MHCIVYKCSNRQNSAAKENGIIFFIFPKDVKKRKSWVNGVLLNWETKTKRNEIQRNETKRSITKRNEICQTKHKRSKHNQWRGLNQQNIEWLVWLFIDLCLDDFLLQNSKRSPKVMHQYSKYSKYILNSLKC